MAIPRSATVIPDKETDQEKQTPGGPTGPRIRCPLCEWQPGPGDLWHCRCGHEWNTFDTGGVCPGCLHQWLSTCCLNCRQWSAHSSWYEY